jgi:hypothetical protein
MQKRGWAPSLKSGNRFSRTGSDIPWRSGGRGKTVGAQFRMMTNCDDMNNGSPLINLLTGVAAANMLITPMR